MFIWVSLENNHSNYVFPHEEVDAWRSHVWLLEDMKATCSTCGEPWAQDSFETNMGLSLEEVTK
jgi:hypothetical protein